MKITFENFLYGMMARDYVMQDMYSAGFYPYPDEES